MNLKFKWYLTGIVILGVIVFVAGLFISSSIEKNRAARIVHLPDLSGVDKSLSDYIKGLHRAALADPSSSEKLGQLGMAYHSNYYYDQAMACYRLAIEYEASEWRWYYFAGLISEAVGDSRAAVNYLQKVVEINPQIAQAWLKLARQNFKLTNYETARQQYEKALTMPIFYPPGYSAHTLPNRGFFPIDAYAALELGRIALTQKKMDKAVRILEELITQHPTFGPGYRLLGQLYYERGNREKGDFFTTRAGDFESYTPPADPIFDSLVLTSRDANFILKQTSLAMTNQNYEWAKILSNSLLELDLDRPAALSNLVRIALDTYAFAEVDPLLERHYPTVSTDKDKLLQMGTYLAQRDQNQNAARYLNRVLELDALSTEARLELARLYIRTGQHETARKELMEILKIDSQHDEAFIEMGIIHFVNGETEKAATAFKQALAIDPGNEVALIWLGIMAEKTGRLPQALDYYSQAIATNPDNANAWLKRGIFLFDMKYWDDAWQNFHDALQHSPNNIDFLERFSWLLATCPDDTIRNGEQALNMAKRLSTMLKIRKEQNITGGMALAAAYAEVGNFQNAREVTNRLIDYTKKIQTEEFLPQLEKMLATFRKNQPYRLPD